MIQKVGNFLVVWTIVLLVILGANSCWGHNETRRNASLKPSNSSDPERSRGLYFNVGIPVPNVPLPDPNYTLEQTLDYWPYHKFYTVSLSKIFKTFKKVFWYLYDLAFLGLRLAFQTFDFLQMRKSYEALGQSLGADHGGSDDDWMERSLRMGYNILTGIGPH